MMADRIKQCLEAAGYQVHYSGPADMEFYAVDQYGHAEPEPNVLYLAAPGESTGRNGVGLLVLESPAEASRVQALLQHIFVAELRLRDHFSRLAQAVAEGCGIYELCRSLARLLDCPVLLLDHRLEAVCRHPEAAWSAQETARLARQVEDWRRSSGGSAPRPPAGYLFREICYTGVDYYLCVPEAAPPVPGSNRAEILDQVCALLTPSASPKEDHRAALLTGLLLRRFPLTAKERERLVALGWKKQEKYYLLAVGCPEEDRALQTELRRILHTDCYPVGNYLVCFLSSSPYLEHTEQDFPQLTRFLKEHGRLGILSMGFFDLADCAATFEQCRTCMEIAQENRYTAGLRYCGRYQMTQILRILLREHQIDLKQYCSPIILQLYALDQAQNTHYLDTLFTYICSGQSVKQTAAAMDLHVNTVYTRFSYLKDQFKIYFNDAHMLYTLHNSIVILHVTCGPGILHSGWPFLPDG